MARTRKSVSTQNLIKYDVLIEDRGTRSDYFKISQFDGYLYGGRNAFLVAGSGVLRPRSKVLVEVLNKDGSTIFSAPVSSFVEGNSRLIQVEVYEDAPIGPGKIVILGSADTYIDGTPIPVEWRGKYNVRWITDVIISPRIENRTQIRFQRPPSMTVSEKFYFAPSSSVFEASRQLPLDIEFNPKFLNVYPNGYLAKIITSGSLPSTTARYFSNFAGGVLSGSVKFVGPQGPETASINLPLNKIYTSKLAESDGNLIVTDKNRILNSLVVSSSGQYTTNISPIGEVGVTSSLNLFYNELTTQDTGSLLSFADIRVVDLETISGEINKVRFSYKSATRPGAYKIIGEVTNEVDELFAVDTGSRIAETGKFRDVIADDYWYTATMSVAKSELNPNVPTYYVTSSLVTGSTVTQCCTDLLDSINATPEISESKFIDNVSYFIGNKDTNSIQLFPRSEYTLTLDALVTKESASYSLSQDDYSLEVYLVPISGSTKLLETNKLGQLIGTLTPRSGFKSQRFNQLELNFVPRIIQSGEFGVRFVVYGGFWNIANVSVKTAIEPFFSPDELDALLPNLEFQNEILEFKAEYLDINNNSIGITTVSLPTFFSGSESTSGGTPVTFPYTGSAIITGSLIVTGSVLISGSSTFRNHGPAEFTGSLKVSGSDSFIVNGPAEITGSLNITENLTVAGALTVQEFYTQFVSSSVFYDSGSTQFGDSDDDRHSFTGSIAVSGSKAIRAKGSAEITGSLIVTDQLIAPNIVSSSTQIESLLPSSVVSSSAQIDHNQTTNYNAAEHFTQANITTVGTVTTGNVKAILPSGVVSASSQVNHDSTTGFVADEHINHSTVSITAGNGLTGGGTIAASRTINVASANNGIVVNADNIQLATASSTFTGGVKNKLNIDGVVSSSAQIDHDQTTNYSADEHFTQASITTVGTVTSGNVNAILPSGVVSASSQINHDSTTGFVANEHIDHSTVSISTGTGLTGGGTIAANRTISLSHLGIQSLTDPNADRILFWDDSVGATAWLSTGTGISISGTTISNSGVTSNVAGTGISVSGATGAVTITNTGVTSVNSVTGAVTATNLLTAIKTVDGASSGLDADLLDGNHASAFYLASNPSGYTSNTGTVTSIATNNGLTGGTITSTGTIGLTGQALALHNLATNGLIARTGTGTVAGRTITAGTGISVSNGNGVSGNPTISLSHLGIQSLTDPNADRILFWDDSVGAVAWLSIGTGLSISGTTLTATGGDLYGSWTARDGDTTTYTITSGDTLQFAEGTGIDVNFTADDVLTFTNTGVTSVAAGGGIGVSASTGGVTISHSDTSSQGSVNNSGRTFIQDITLDTYGHVTAITSATDSDTFTGTVTSIATNNGITGGTITTSGTIGLTGQALALHNLGTNGLIARTGTGTVAGRTITAGTGISVTNGNGVSGNPTITNTGVTSNTAGTGISVSGTTGASTISHADTSALNGVYGGNGISDITVDSLGHVTNIGTATFTLSDGTNASGTWGINISGTAAAVAYTLSRGSYLTGNNYNGSAATTWAVDATSTNTANKVVARDGSGNFNAGTVILNNVGVGTSSIVEEVTVDGNIFITAGNSLWIGANTDVGNRGRFHQSGSDLYIDWGSGILYLRSGTSGSTPRASLNGSGVFTATGDVQVSSDIRLKNELNDEVGGLSIVNNLRPIKYVWKDGRDSGRKQLGFSAQEVLKLVPEIVREQDGYYSVAYQKLVPVLVKAIQELTEEVEKLKKIVGE